MRLKWLPQILQHAVRTGNSESGFFCDPQAHHELGDAEHVEIAAPGPRVWNGALVAQEVCDYTGHLRQACERPVQQQGGFTISGRWVARHMQ